ncbi:Meiotic Sister-Chromatid recombination aldehyde dehydrogenase [Rhizina undulata]
MAMRLSFDFLVNGFTVGCSVTKEGFSFKSLDESSAFSTASSSVIDNFPSGESVLWALVGLILSVVFHKYRQAVRFWAVDYSVPVPEQCAQDWDAKVLEKPSIKSSDDLRMIQCYCPANGKLLGTVAPADKADIDAAIDRAAAAQKEWARTSFDERKQVLRSLLKYIIENQDTIATAACLDSGKTKIDAALGEILVTVEKIKWMLREGEKALKPEKRNVSWPLMLYKKAEVRYEPLGVVCACVSWNYPFHNLIGPVLSSIFAGNGIIVKGSENTAWSSGFFASIIQGALEACGHNPDLVQSVICWPEVAPHLTSHPKISHITFIGSRPVAHHVASSAAKQLTPLCVELGGKDASIVLDDTRNLKSLASILMRGVFQSASQNCVGIERIIVLPKVYPQLIALLEPRIKALRLGSILDDEAEGVDVGAMISDANFDHLEKLIQEAVAQGAKCLVGGNRYKHPKHPSGHYFTPTLLVDVTPSMAIAQEETFAPICLIMPATSIDHAIAIANSTEYALGGSVYGKNKWDLEKVTNEMKCGMVAVNDFAVYYLNQSLPFGGIKGSGYGRFAGEEGLRGVCALKSVCKDRWHGWVGTGIPPVVDYPIKNGSKAWGFTKGLVQFGYGEGAGAKAGGLAKIMGNM